MYGGDGDDFLYGNNGNDEMYGGDADDWIYGNNDDDIIHGGWGDDRIWGGTGADTFRYDIDDGNDTIEDFEIGTDILDLQRFWDAYVDDWAEAFGFGSDTIFIADHGNDAVISASTNIHGVGGEVGLVITLRGLAGTTLSDLNDAGSIVMP